MKYSRSHRRPSLVPLFALGALGVFIAPAACNSSPEIAGEGGASCSTDSDCESDLSCSDDGVCRGSCSSADDCGSGEFCSTDDTCKAQCDSCGAACEETEDCPTGQFCVDDACQQECTPGTEGGECGSLTCSDDGECVSEVDDDITIGNGGQGGSSGDGDANEDCIDVEVEFEPQIPNVVLLIDQSGSMNASNDFGDAVQSAITADTYETWDCPSNNNWRWNVVRNVLLNPDGGVVKPLEEDVRFGLTLYSSDDGFLNDATCPNGTLTSVEPAFGNHQAMLEEMLCSDIAADTPTRESLTAVANNLAALELDGPEVIVLATDGLPDNCTCPDWEDRGANDSTLDCDGDAEDLVDRPGLPGITLAAAEQYDVVVEAQRIHDELGISIEVINLNKARDPNNPNATESVLADHLDDVAERGGAVSGAAIDGFDPGALADAFQSIIDGVRSCAIELDGEIEDGKEDTGTVLLDGTELILDDPNGWVVNSPTQIELVGDACETIKSGDHDLDISFPCGAFVVVLK